MLICAVENALLSRKQMQNFSFIHTEDTMYQNLVVFESRSREQQVM